AVWSTAPGLPRSSPVPCTTLFRSAAAMRAALTGMGLVVRSSFPNKSFATIPEAAGFLAGLTAGTVQASALAQVAGELRARSTRRSEAHTSELQSRANLVCRLPLDS